MRILFVHEVNYRNKFVFEMHEFPELLALRGHDVAFFHYPEAPDNPEVSLQSTREVIAGRAYPAASIELITPPTLGGTAAERYLAPLLDLPALLREIRRGRYDLIVLYAVPTTGWQTVAIARRAGVPVVFRALDVSHELRKNALSWLIRRAERYIYKNATLLSANNPAMADYCVQESGRTGPIAVDLPPVDLSHFVGASDDTGIRERLGIDADARVILYMGSFFRFSGLEPFLEVVAPYLSAMPRLKVVLVGGGEIDTRLRERVGELGVEAGVHFTGVVPYSELPGYLRVADVAVNPFLPQLLTHVAFPHKVLQYMASGVPAVSTSLRGLRGVLGDASGVTWGEGPADVAAKSVSLALSNREELDRIAQVQIQFVDRVFSMDAATASFERTLQSVG